MLPPAARLTHRDDFAAVVRRGRRAGRRLVVMHVLVPDSAPDGDVLRRPVAHSNTPLGADHCPRVGFVVSKAVGDSVVRHRVARRLRHLMRDRLHRLPPATRVVVRALPASADAPSAQLGADLDRALQASLTVRERASGGRSERA